MIKLGQISERSVTVINESCHSFLRDATKEGRDFGRFLKNGEQGGKEYTVIRDSSKARSQRTVGR